MVAPLTTTGGRGQRQHRELPGVIVLVAIIGWIVISRPSFHHPENLVQVSQDIAALGILACGEALVVLTGGIDLSVAAIAAASACLTGSLLTRGYWWPAALGAGVLLGALLGSANGLLIAVRRFPPILVTLAALLGIRAATFLLTVGTPYNMLPAGFRRIGAGYLPLVVFGCIATMLALFIARHRAGRHLMATGGSEAAARLCGVATSRVLWLVYLCSGLLAALAGIVMTADGGSAQWNLGDGMELNVVAAVVIGGVRLTGGEGTIAGASIGACIIVVLSNALFLSGVVPEKYGLVTGGVILAAAVAEQVRIRRVGAQA